MGTDCRVIAKLNDGTIKCRTLDRLYVFDSSSESDHKGLTGGIFSIEEGLNWCNERLQINRSQIVDENTYTDPDYHNHWVSELKSFLLLIKGDLVDSVKILGDYEREYDELFIYENHEFNIVEI